MVRLARPGVTTPLRSSRARSLAMVAGVAVLVLAAGCTGSASLTPVPIATRGSTATPAPTSAPAPTPTPPATSPAAATTTPAAAMIADPPGDVGLPNPPGYLDGLAAGVAKDAGVFIFRFVLAEPIPRALEIPNGWDSIGWSFCLDTDRAAPKGYPFSPSTAVPCEFILLLRSSGGPLKAELIDRRTMQDGKDAVVTPLDNSIDGATVTVSLPVGAIGDPASFTWVWATTLLDQLGTNTFKDVDEIPDSSFADPAPWPPSR
jgi:hypothetical protein